jgi:hypothetical protein
MARQSLPLPLSDRPTVVLNANALDLELLPLEPGEAPSLEVSGGREALKGISIEREGDATRIELPGFWSGFELPSRLTLKVPQHVRARIANDAGRIRVEGLAGCDLDLVSQMGSITLEDVRGRLKLQVDSGSIKGDHLAGTFDVRSTAGSVKLRVDALDEGTHVVRTTMGSVKVELAKGQAVKIETRTSLGTTRTRYPSTEDAKRVLKLEADLGSVKVSEVDGVEDERHGDWPDWRRTWNDVASAVAATFNAPAGPVAPTPPKADVSAEVRKVLEMVSQGVVSVDDAERLIRAMR